nr:hypothetical protein [Tanacetum cinerariifolium]
MIAILEKYEHNADFHQIVDFVEASHLRYALTINPTVYVSHIRQFWSTARMKTTDEGTKILATIDALPTVADEPASPFGDENQEQDRVNIIKTSTLPHDSPPRVTSLAADEGSMQHQLNELTDLCTHLQRQQTEMASKLTTQDLEIASLKAIIKMLEDRDGGGDDPSREDATIKGRQEFGDRGGSSVLPAAEVATVSIPPTGEIPTVSVPTGSGVVPTASPIFTTATVATPYSRRKCKEKMVESETPNKKKLQEQIDVQVTREMEEQLAREDQRMDEQIARDAEIAKIHVEKELQMLINRLDRNNETVAKSHAGWKTKHFKGMSLDELRDKFVPVWKQIKDFIPMGSKEEGERFKRKGLRLEQDIAKKAKTSEEVSEEDLKEMMQLVPVEEVYVEALQVKHPIINWEIHTKGKRSYWKIIRLGESTASYQFFVDMLKHFDREDLNQLWELVKETLNIRQATSDKEKELWVELKRLYESNVEDQLWTQTQALMHDPVEWRLYDSCGVHYVLSRDQEISMLVERDCPLRKGHAIVMEHRVYGRIVRNKMLKSFPLPVMSSHCQKTFPLLVKKGSLGE